MMICPYCQTKLEPRLTQRLTQHISCIYVCPCGVEFNMKNNQMFYWSFYTIVNQQKFMLIFITQFGGTQSFSIWDDNRRVLQLSILPNITPTNAQEKIPLYLLFS